ncbi:MAG: BamA/TamA family outer membrane protein [Bacteroidales bacterium]|nr:BamA/TamA family outer membrane protein [Bacteroidales bacterium]
MLDIRNIIASFAFLLLCLSSLAYDSDSTKYFIIQEIAISGNEKTKPQVILREFPYSVGDSIPCGNVESEIASFSDNLSRLMLFNNIDVSYTTSDSSKINIEVNLTERWYYWVYPILEIADRNITSYFYYRDYKKINYGAAFDWLNFRGRNEMLNFKLRLGYKEHYAVSYQKPNIGKRNRFGIWATTEFFRQKKDIADIVSNKPVYAENEDKYIRNMLNVGVGAYFRPRINYDFSLSLNYQNINSKDSLLTAKVAERQNYFVPAFSFSYDNRDNKVAPKSGIEANLGARVFASTNSTAFAFVNASFEFNTNIYKQRLYYHGTLAHQQFFGDDGNIPANKKIELCKNYLIRAFDYYYIIGASFSSIKNTFSVKILNRRDFSLPKWIPQKFRRPYIQIFLDLFADLAFCTNFADTFSENNTLCNVPMYSAGAGLSFETYYDRVLNVYAGYNGNFNSVGVFVEYKTPIYKKF